MGAAALVGCRSVRGGAVSEPGGKLSVLISDLHVGGANPTYEYTHARLAKVVDAILAMNPRPDNVICFGDVAELHQDDFYFRTPTSIVPRPALWDARVRDGQGQAMHFHV